MEAASVQSLLGTLGLVTMEGVKRINTTELQQVSGAGSLLERIKAQASKAIAGQPLPEKLQNDLGELSSLLEKSARKKYEQGFDSVTKRYKLNDENIIPSSTETDKSATSAVPSNVSAVLKGAAPGKHTLSDGSVWTIASDGTITKGS